MDTDIKSLIKNITTSTFRNRIRKYIRKVKHFLKRNQKPTTIEDLKNVLTKDLGLKRGDNIIVSSAFGNLHSQYSPEEVIELLQSIVTEEGVIMMPYYPTINSNEWAHKDLIFDMKSTISGMGILTNVFSKMPNVYKSIHPTKAVCVWGKNAQEIVKGHKDSLTPFYWDSPYGKLLKLGCKSLGLGLKNIPIFHSYEDILSPSPFLYYEKDIYNLKVKNGNKILEIKTHVHDSNILAKCLSAGDYVASLHCNSYKKIQFGYTFIYIIDNKDLFNRTKLEFSKGNTRLKK